MEIVRLSGDPLIQDSLSAPEPGFIDDESGAQYCLRHCKEDSFSEYITEEFEYEDSVRPCKISSTFHRRENNIFADLICWLVLAARCYVMAW